MRTHFPKGYSKLQIFLNRDPETELACRCARGDLTEAWWNTNHNQPQEPTHSDLQNSMAGPRRAKFLNPDKLMARLAG
jgi:hypothetical protein